MDSPPVISWIAPACGWRGCDAGVSEGLACLGCDPAQIPAEIGRHMQCSEKHDAVGTLKRLRALRHNRTARARRWNCHKRPNAPARFHGVSDLGAD